jgi:hypothetical protein
VCGSCDIQNRRKQSAGTESSGVQVFQQNIVFGQAVRIDDKHLKDLLVSCIEWFLVVMIGVLVGEH